FLALRCRTYLRQRPSTRQAAFLLLVCCLISNLTIACPTTPGRRSLSCRWGNTIFLGLCAWYQERQPVLWIHSSPTAFCFLRALSDMVPKNARPLSGYRHLPQAISRIVEAPLIL